MATPKKQLKMRRLALTLPAMAVAVIAGPTSAVALTGVGTSKPASQTTHPKQKHCRAHYVKKAETVKKREHGRLVKVHETVCVYVAPVKTPALAPMVPLAPVPTPAPIPTPAPVPPTNSDPLQVTVTVWDPINTNNEFEKPKAGQRFIAVELHLTNISSRVIESDADLDTTVIGTNSQTYTAALGDERANCTDFASGGFALSPGAKETGCVVYELPEGVKAATVQFGLNFNAESSFSIEGR